MASKRSLYRPAQVQENVGQRKNRKALAQGRLIVGDRQAQGSIPVVHSEAPLHTSHVSSAGNISRLQTSLVQGKPDDSLFSPRRLAPQCPEQNSSSYSHPAGSLDLSDSDLATCISHYRLAPQCPEQNSSSFSHPAGSLDLSDSDADASKEKSIGERSHYQKPAEVLCVDASRQTINPDVSEVDIRIGVDSSPVKIVCHSPAALRQQHAENGLDRVAIDVPSSQSSSKQGRTKPRTPIIVREKIAGSHIDPYTAVQSIPMSPPLGERIVLQSLSTNYPQPNFDDPDESAVSSRLGHEASGDLDDVESVASENDACSLNEYVGSARKTKPTNKQQGSAKKDLPKRPQTATKKKGTVVPSRYMQAVKPKAKASLSQRIDKSIADKSKASRSLEVNHLPTSRKTAKMTRSAEAQGRKERPHTPENQSITSTGGKTSTPTMDGSIFPHEMDIDASAIHPEVSLLVGDHSHLLHSNVSTGKTRSRINEMLGHSVVSNTGLNHTTMSTVPHKKKVDSKALQQELELLWMYNLQWAFLEGKAKKQLKDQEKQAMAQIYGLYEVNEQLTKEKAKIEQEYMRLKHTNNADQLTEIQRQCLGPVTNTLSPLKKQYRSLAQALDTTRHQVPTTDIYLPDNEEQYQAELEKHLLESERLLGEISAVSRQETPTISNMARNMEAMEQAVDGMDSELRKNRELLAATESLTMHECSLRVQEIQLMDKS